MNSNVLDLLQILLCLGIGTSIIMAVGLWFKGDDYE